MRPRISRFARVLGCSTALRGVASGGGYTGYYWDAVVHSTSMAISGTNSVTCTGTATDVSTGYSAAGPVLSGTGTVKFQVFGAAAWVIGIANPSGDIESFPGFNTNSAGWYSFDGSLVYGGAAVPGYQTPVAFNTAGDVLEIEYDIPGAQCRARVNGGTYSAWVPFAGLGAGPYRLCVGVFNTGAGATIIP